MGWLWLAAALLAQEASLEPFLGLSFGRSWTYRSDDGSSKVVTLVATTAGSAAAFTRDSIAGSRQQESFDPEGGLQMHSQTLDSGDTIEYERPVVLIPSRLAPAEVHQSQRRFVRRRGETKVDVGAHHFETELLGFEDVETPAGGFERCLKLRRGAVRMDFSGSQERLELVEWYAEGVGLVKAEGTRSWREAEGGEFREEPLELVLSRREEPRGRSGDEAGSTSSGPGGLESAV